MIYMTKYTYISVKLTLKYIALNIISPFLMSNIFYSHYLRHGVKKIFLSIHHFWDFMLLVIWYICDQSMLIYWQSRSKTLGYILYGQIEKQVKCHEQPT